MLRPYLKIWDRDLIFGRAVKVISSPGVRSPCRNLNRFSVRRHGGYSVHANLDGVALQMTSNRTNADKKPSTGQTVGKACNSVAQR